MCTTTGKTQKLIPGRVSRAGQVSEERWVLSGPGAQLDLRDRTVGTLMSSGPGVFRVSPPAAVPVAMP